jgi:hypothetical protein
MGCQHSEFKRHTKVLVIMNDGSSSVDRYIEKKSGVIVLRSLGRLKLSQVRQVSIYRGDFKY